jgi:ABC-type glycerol-3-phosphate transport system substrate-binding protein
VWVVPTHQPERTELGIELAEFLTESSYMGSWSEAAGYLPTRPSALTKWMNNTTEPVIDLISSSAQELPASDVLNSLGQILSKAVGQVLNQQSNPQEAAREAVESLTGP